MDFLKGEEKKGKEEKEDGHVEKKVKGDLNERESG